MAGVLIPGLVVMALIVIPYFKVNIEAEGLFQKDRENRLRIFYMVAGGLSLFLLLYKSRLYNAVLGIKGEAEPLYAGACPDPDHFRADDSGVEEFAAIAFAVPALSCGQAAFLSG